MAKLTVERLAKMIAALADENGVPNGVSPGELCEMTEYRPMDVGRLVMQRRGELNAALRLRGYTISDYGDFGEGYGKRIGIAAASD